MGLSEATELVQKGEKLIVGVCGKGTISRDEYETFNNEIDSIYNSYFNGKFGELLFDNTEYEDIKNDVLHIKRDVFYPTSLHKGIAVISANIVSQYYENDFFNSSVLTIREEYSGSDKQLLGFYREYIYKKNDSGEWVFYGFGGTGNYTGEGFDPEYLEIAATLEPMNKTDTAGSPIQSSQTGDIATETGKQNSQEHYFESALDGDPEGLFKLSASDGMPQIQKILLLKAASSMDYSADYFSMAYGGLEGYSADEPKFQIVARLEEVWDNETDPAAVKLKNSIRANQYFSKEFAQMLVKTSYTYSYHAFAQKYGISPNRSFKDGKGIIFAVSNINDDFENYAENMAEQYLKFEECEFYELDFDGDGDDEIGIPLHSGAGGAFMADGFGIFKKNREGLYEEYAGGPDCTLRDAMRLIKYENRIYFITNPFSDTMNEPHNITAYYIDKDGQGHGIGINCIEYRHDEILKKVYGNYKTDEFRSLLTDVTAQAYEAIAATKRHEMYNRGVTKQVKSSGEPEQDFYGAVPADVYFTADINNDGAKEFVRKAHVIIESKYYNDYNLLQIYDNESELLENAQPMLDTLPQDDYYGLHSGGNLYDILPVKGQIVQFWTCEKDNRTYCIALTRNELLYGLHVYYLQNENAATVCQSLIFDEVQDVEITFSGD